MSVQFSPFSGHCLCCFSCTQFHRLGLWACRLWLSGIRGVLPICVLFATKSKRSSDLPVIEKCEAYMLGNHPGFGSIAEELFLEGTRLLSSLEKINNSFLRKEFCRNCQRFLEDLVSTILSTVAACSPVGHGLSCFCPEIVIGGDKYSVFHLLGQLLDGLFELGWVNGSELEPAKAEFHSFVREQQQVEASGNRSRVPINSVLNSATSLISVLGRNCTKLALWCFEVISIFS